MEDKFKLFDFSQERVRVLHYTWIAFFLTFYVWFNMAPIKSLMIESFDFLTDQNIKSLLICNVALTIPARIIIGSLVDRYGPRVVFSGLMVVTTIPGLMFAFGDSFTQLVVSRLLLSSIGAGFVIGIKMTANWFPPKMIGRAEGFYAGWGNFGSAAAAGIVPIVAISLIGGEFGWRYSLALSSIVCGIYGVMYFFLVKDYPFGKEPKEVVKKASIMPVSSYGDLIQYILWTAPMNLALGLLAKNLQKQIVHGENMFSENMLYIIWAILAAFYLYKVMAILKVNLPRLKAGVPESEKYPFSSVSALNTTYFANFGAELAVVSMLPAFFFEVFEPLKDASGERIVTLTMAGLVAGSFAFINLVARPLGGYLSDKMGSRKKTMLIYMLGIALGFAAMGFIGKYSGNFHENGAEIIVPTFDGTWWLVVSVIITMGCSMFVQGAEGATFAVIPAIKKELTGRIAGMAGAYGNVGAVTYLYIFTMVNEKTFFFILAGGAFFSFIYCWTFLKEPENSFGEDDDLETIPPIMEMDEDAVLTK
jgi:NNP family nitrate/nitrite transporter-like MFS transporter